MKYYLISNITRLLLAKLRKYHKDNEQLLVFSNDFIGEEVFSYGIYEKEEINTIINSLDFDTSKNYAIDIGANIGNHAIQFSKYFNKIYCFEPNKVAFDVLKINIRNRKNIEIINTGLSNENRKSNLNIPDSNIGGASVSLDVFKNNQEIELKIFDELFKEKFSFVKLDVEGHEFQVIKGMINSINKNKPIICFELINSKESDLEIILLLKELGYQKFHITYERRIFNSNSYFIKFLSGLFFKNTLQLVELKKFDKKFYNLVICEHINSTYKIKRDTIKK